MENFERLVVDLIESLKREVHALDRKVSEGFARIETKFDTQAARRSSPDRNIET